MATGSSSSPNRSAVEEEIRAVSEAKWRWVPDDLDRLEDVFDDKLVFVHLNALRERQCASSVLSGPAGVDVLPMQPTHAVEPRGASAARPFRACQTSLGCARNQAQAQARLDKRNAATAPAGSLYLLRAVA